jgi:hypothetical protein
VAYFSTCLDVLRKLRKASVTISGVQVRIESPPEFEEAVLPTLRRRSAPLYLEVLAWRFSLMSSVPSGQLWGSYPARKHGTFQQKSSLHYCDKVMVGLNLKCTNIFETA